MRGDDEMTAKHKALELADWINDTEFYDNPNPELNDKMDEVESMLRQQQAEMDIVIKLLCEEQVPDDLMAYWNPLHSTLKSKLLKAQKK